MVNQFTEVSALSEIVISEIGKGGTPLASGVEADDAMSLGEMGKLMFKKFG